MHVFKYQTHYRGLRPLVVKPAKPLLPLTPFRQPKPLKGVGTIRTH